MPAEYQISRVQKSYLGRLVLDIDELRIEPGEILSIVGPSGSGKSTLLRILNFLEAPDSGDICFRGEKINFNLVPIDTRRKVTTVFQKPSLLSGSVAANVKLGLKLRGDREGKNEISKYLDLVGLSDLHRAQARSLSGGEAQRVALARALIFNPNVLLLDEPTANLDPYHVELIERVIKERNQKEGTTVVLVTHNIFQAHRLADRVALLLNGSFIEITDTDTFFNHPNDARTKAFNRGEMVW